MKLLVGHTNCSYHLFIYLSIKRLILLQSAEKAILIRVTCQIKSNLYYKVKYFGLQTTSSGWLAPEECVETLEVDESVGRS